MSKGKFLRKVFMMSCLMMFVLVLGGCSNEKEITLPEPDRVTTVNFDVETGDSVVISVDETGGYKLVKREDGFDLIEVSQDDTKIASSVTGVFLNKSVVERTAMEFQEKGTYQSVMVDGAEGFSFSGVNDTGIQVYAYVVPCGESGNTYVEIFSTVSEEELQNAIKNVHISVTE